MNWVLVYVLLSSGPGADPYWTERECLDAMIELEAITKRSPDLWSATCSGPDGEWIKSTKTVGGIGP